MKTDFECSLHLELLTGMCATRVGGGMLGRAPSDESLDKFTRLSSISSFMECNRGGWTLDIYEGCDTRSVDAAMRATLNPNALYRPGGSSQSWPSSSWNLSWRMVLSTLPVKHWHILVYDRPLQSASLGGHYDLKL
jgi:hypothetical protein